MHWPDCYWCLLPGGWTYEKHRLLLTSTDCITPVGTVAHYESLVHSGLLVEDSLQKSALWQLDWLLREMVRYTNLPLPQTKESSKESRDDVSGVSKPEQMGKDVTLITSIKEKECTTENVSFLNIFVSCHTWLPFQSYSLSGREIQASYQKTYLSITLINISLVF